MAYQIEIEREVEGNSDKWWSLIGTPTGWDKWFTTNAVFTKGTYQTDDGDYGTLTDIIPYSCLEFTWENPKHQPTSNVRFSIDEGIVSITHSDIATESLAKELEAAWNKVADKLASL
ncbi:MAG: hypothetical protein ABIV13_00870 [Fimbriimonadales bacterium]